MRFAAGTAIIGVQILNAVVSSLGFTLIGSEVEARLTALTVIVDPPTDIRSKTTLLIRTQ